MSKSLGESLADFGFQCMGFGSDKEPDQSEPTDKYGKTLSDYTHEADQNNEDDD